MGKVALLIAVAEYQFGFEALAAAKNDLQAMQRVLQMPEAGDFAADAVKAVLNPDPQQMREELEILFANRRKEDLVVFYFSGHGVTDDRGNFYLASTGTHRDRLRATAVSASYILGLMEDSRSKQQVAILDCCFSGAFAKDMTAKGEPVNLGAQLGGQGRAVLTSSSATEYSFEQKEAKLSIYTRYLVEGLMTGAADQNEDGWIELDELYEFTREKVQEAAPAMQPKIYAAEAGYKIRLSKAPLGDPKLEYRKAVKQYVYNGEISFVGRNILNALRDKLALSAAEAAQIENLVLQPHKVYEEKRRRFATVVEEAIKQENPLSQRTLTELKKFQQILGLRDQDVAPIEAQITGQPVGGKDSAEISAAQTAHQPRQNTSRETTTTASTKQPIAQSSGHSEAPAELPRRNLKTPILLGAGAFVLLMFGLFAANLNDTETNSVPDTQTFSAEGKSAQAYYEEGYKKHNNNDYEGAIIAFDQAIELDPEYALAYNDRGLAKRQLGDYAGAIADFDRAIELNPEYAQAYNSRGVAKRRSGDYSGAIADYDEAIALDPEYAQAYNNRGFAKRLAGDNQEAIADYDEAIELNPEYAVAYRNRGLAKEDAKDYRGALADYDKAIELDPDYTFAYNDRGIVKRRLGDYAGAIADFDRAIELNPEYAQAYNHRGLAKESLEDYQSAIPDYDKAIELVPEYAQAYNNRGFAKESLEDYQGALADYNKAIELNPDYALAYFNRGFAKKGLGDNEGAFQDYRRAADLYQQQGDTENYQDALDQIQSLQQS